jgi:hypothetical protein
MRPIGTISALLVVAVLAVSSAADAAATKTSRAKSHKSHASSRVTVETVGQEGVTGRVSGSEKACRTQRQVTVYRVNSGSSVPSSEFVATAWTHGDGSWAIPGPLYPSEFFAVVSPRSAKRVICGPATSNSLLWG